MHWTPRAELTLDELIAQVPTDYQDSVRVAARRTAQLQALQIGNPLVDVDEVVMGYLQSAPAHLRPELMPVLQAAGIDTHRYRQYLN